MPWGKRIVAIAWLCSALVACGGGSRGGEVERAGVEVSGDVPHRIVGTVDQVWLGVRHGRNVDIVISHDDGRTWQAVELPARPPQLSLPHSGMDAVHLQPDLAVVVGRDETSARPGYPVAQPEFIAWTSPDGIDWDVEVLGTAGGIVGEPTVTAAGSVLVAATSSTEGFNMFTSDDRGSSWQRAVMSGLVHVPGEDTVVQRASADGDELQVVVHASNAPAGRRQVLTSVDGGTTWTARPCVAGECLSPDGVGDVILDDDAVSVDGGATWEDVAIEPPMRGDGNPMLDDLVEVHDGWLARASTSEVGDIDFEQLIRSDDGRSWEQMLPTDPCGGGRPNIRVSRPVLFRGRWYVSYGCSDLMFPEFAMIYVADPDAREFRLLDGSERDGVVFAAPFEDDDRLIFPEYDGDGELVGLTTVS